MARAESYRIAEGTDHETAVHVHTADRDGPTTFVVGGLHGDEPSGYRAAGRIADWVIDRGELVVLPRANTVAIERDSRYDADGDLNRKFPPRGGECDTDIAREIWEAVERHDPDWAFDLHSSRGIWQSGDGGVGQALFPTWTPPARAYGWYCVRDLNEEFGLPSHLAYRMGDTLDADRPMLMHRVAGMLDEPGLICETTEKADLDDQIRWHLFTVEHVMSQYGQPPVTGPRSELRRLWVDDLWQRYRLERAYENPVVVAKPLSYRGTDPAHARLGSVTGDGFDCRIEEWEYLNGVHLGEQVGSLAHESGTHRTTSGTPIEAGTVTTDGSWRRVTFEQSFRTTPVVVAQPQTVRGSQPVVVRLRDVTERGFGVQLQEEEAADGDHVAERVGYVAVGTGEGVMHGARFEARRLPAGVTDEWTRIGFDREYPEPVLLSGIQSFNGPNTCELRYADLTPTGVRVRIEDERSADEETNHVREEIGLCVFEG